MPLASTQMITLPDVCERTSLSRSTVWRLLRQERFPKPFRLSENRVAWSEAEVAAWLHARREASN